SSIRYLTSSLAYHADMLYFESTIASVFFHDTATTDISTLSLHDALPILFLESQRAQVTLNSIGDAVISTDVAGNVTYLNAVAESMTGWPRLEASGRPLQEVLLIIDGDSREAALNPLAMAMLHNKSVRLS